MTGPIEVGAVTGEIIPPQRPKSKPIAASPMEGVNLDVLAAEINRQHEEAVRLFCLGFEKAVEAGKLLIEAKRLCPHGGWLPWLKANVTCAPRTAQVYMRLAREVPKLAPEKAQRVAHLSLRDGIREIADNTSKINKLPAPEVEKVFATDDGNRRTAVRQAHSRRQYDLAPRRPEPLPLSREQADIRHHLPGPRLGGSRRVVQRLRLKRLKSDFIALDEARHGKFLAWLSKQPGGRP